MLRVKLRYLDKETAHRRKVAGAYLKSIDNPLITLPAPHAEAHAWHVFVIRCNQREAMRQHLADQGIQTLIHYPIPPHHQQAYKERNLESYPLSEIIHQQVLSLPMGPTITDEQIAAVVKACNIFQMAN